ncbi:MAG: tetratricopeptide repeat protein, partial [bacterium]
FDIAHFDSSGRLFMWRVAAGMIRERPLAGFGPGGFGPAYPERQARLAAARPGTAWFYTDNAHNDWLQLPAEEGVPVFGLWIWVWAVFIRMARRRWRRGSGDALGLLLGFAAFQVNAIVNFPWYLLPAHGWFWLSFGWLLAGERSKAPAPPGSYRRAAMAVCALLSAAMGGRDLVANGWLKLSGDAVAAARWPQARVAAERSIARRGFWEGGVRAEANASSAAFNLGDFAGAEAHAREAIRLAPGSPSAWVQLGLASARAGKLDEAVAACRRALELNPGPADACHVLGNVAFLEHDLRGADEWWSRAVDANPALTGARDSLAALRRTHPRR